MKNVGHHSWRKLLADPRPGDHIVQLYDEDEFHAEAVSHFAAEGLARGEAIILVPTRIHWSNISAKLAAKGFAVERLVESGQLTVFDAEATLPRVMNGGTMVDEKIYSALAVEAMDRARGDERFRGVRWWGELVGMLGERGNTVAAERLEHLYDSLARPRGLKSFCSYFMNKFDGAIYGDGSFASLCSSHSHLIPARDYVVHRTVINRAVAKVLGEMDGALLRSLMSWDAELPDMPSSHALLLWLRQALPERFDEVLAAAHGEERALHPHPAS